MDRTVVRRLLELNRTFYAMVAEPFDQTRQTWPPGMARLLDYVPVREGMPLRVLDAGCGNGRFARLLQSHGLACTYTGVDGDARLLQLAREQTAHLCGVAMRLVQADLAETGWAGQAGLATAGYDLVVCLATLQHLPGFDLRQRVLGDLAACLAPGGRLVASAWQFLDAPRFAVKQIDWATVGLQAVDAEPGDALLPWKQGQYAVRYVHQIDATEMAQLAANAGLAVVDAYRADGKEGDLNLYIVMGEVA